MLENYIILGWATGGVLSLIIPAYSLFATMNTVAAINSYFYLTNDILLEKYDMNFNTDIMYQPKEDWKNKELDLFIKKINNKYVN